MGGGPGRYTIALLERGYDVTLVDLSPSLLEKARLEIERAGLTVPNIKNADARGLSFFADSSLDAALLMGPMYHLATIEARMGTLSELRRVLKPGAPAIVAYINGWGVLRALIHEHPQFFVESDRLDRLVSGMSQVGPQREFTEAHFSSPPLALGEVEKAGFSVLSYAGVEGFASGMLGPMAQLAETQPVAYQNVIRFAAEHCEAPQWRDSTEHLHIVVRK